MNEIELKNRHGETVGVAICDDVDAAALKCHRWHITKSGYAAYTHTLDGKKRYVFMHRLLMNPPDEMEVDHINSNKLDNRRANLRICTHAENLRNRKMHRNNTSGFSGVHRRGDRWRAKVEKDGKQYYAGTYSTQEEAARARDAMALELQGAFARPNFVEAVHA